MQSFKVSVHIAVQGEIAGRPDDHTLIVRSLEVANNCLDCGSVALLRIVREACNLADCKCDIWASIRRKVEEHPDHGAIAPRLLHRRTVGVDSKRGLPSGSPIAVAHLHPCCFLFLLN